MRAENLSLECASCGYIELVLFSLCQREDEIFGPQPVELSNAKTSSFTHGRSSLLPGLLRAASANQHRPLPLRLFECAEVFVLDDAPDNDTGASTRRRLGALHGGVTDGFSDVHGLLDRVAARMGVSFELRREDNPAFVPGRRAAIMVGGRRVGAIGVPAVDVLRAYRVPFPVSVFELDIE